LKTSGKKPDLIERILHPDSEESKSKRKAKGEGTPKKKRKRFSRVFTGSLKKNTDTLKKLIKAVGATNEDFLDTNKQEYYDENEENKSSVDDLIKKCTEKKYTSIALFKCANLDDDTLEKIVKANTQLVVLSIRNCDKVTSKGLQAVAKELKGLKVLDISGCKGIKDDGIQAIVNSCSSLYALLMENTEGIKDDAIANIEKCPDLTQIVLAPGMGDKALEYLTKNKKLKFVDCGGNKEITEKGLNALKTAVSTAQLVNKPGDKKPKRERKKKKVEEEEE
jgi:hypothetical protein